MIIKSDLSPISSIVKLTLSPLGNKNFKVKLNSLVSYAPGVKA